MKEFKRRLGLAMPAIVLVWLTISGITKMSEGVFLVGILIIFGLSLWLYITGRFMGLIRRTP